MSATDALRRGLAVPRTNVLEHLGDNRAWIVGAHPKGSGPHIDRFMQLASATIGLDPELAACDPDSVLQAVVDVARFGLELGDVRAQAWIAVRDGRAKMQLGYRGVIDLAGRAGIICEVHDVHEHDTFEFSWGIEQRLVHTPHLRGDRGDTYAWWAVARIRGHDPVVHVMSRPEIEQVRDAHGIATGETSAWRRHFDAMARKTVLLRLTNYLPYTDPVFADALARDAVNAGLTPPAPTTMLEVPHARITEHDQRDPLVPRRDHPDHRDDRPQAAGEADPGPVAEGPRGDSPSPHAPHVDAVADDDTALQTRRALTLGRYTRDAMFQLAEAHGIETMSAWNGRTLTAKLLTYLPADPDDWRVAPSEPF